MQIGIVSDTHISGQNRGIPDKILEFLKEMDMILHAGDVIDLRILDVFKSVCRDVRAVRGNMDPLDVTKCLPEKQIIKAGRYKIGLTHGNGSPASLIEVVTDVFKDDRVDIIVFGHSHYPINEKRGGILYFNPGTLTDTMFSSFNSYGIIEINDKINAKIVKI
jgi:hypothetical protein